MLQEVRNRSQSAARYDSQYRPDFSLGQNEVTDFLACFKRRLTVTRVNIIGIQKHLVTHVVTSLMLVV